MALTIDDIKLHMVPHEGHVVHMYLDTVGKVTVGIGNMLPNAAAAQELAFINRTTKTAATKDEIKSDFDEVAKQTWGMPSSKYKPNTKLDLPDVHIDQLFEGRVEEFTQQLSAYFPDYAKYPDPAQLAILDMAFNLGAPALDKKWPSFKKAVLAQDWATAEKECVRPKSRPSRNEATQALFRKAAELAKAAAEHR